MELLPVNGWGWNVLSATEIRTGLVLNGIILFLLATLGFMLSRVDERTGYRGRLEQNDPVALLTEIIRIEWRLKSRHQEVVLISVDVAKSRAMKAECDPLLAEYSFREYQDFLAGIAQSNEGFVYSTAGDGALLAFTHVSHAFRAAREIQTNVSYFNEHVNKMPSKFRLRVGVHMGEVPGDIREVEFNEVIDTVSHVQRVAPIRGIVVTRPVADELKGESLIPLKEPVSGVEVFLAYDPTVTV
jgi:class 3 adenylate cyclase